MKLGPYSVPGSYTGDCRDLMRELPDECVQCVVTSPPYWGLRDYGVGGQLGLEQTPSDYVQAMVGVFREVRRVLRGDGTLWLNLGDSYQSGKGMAHGIDPKSKARRFGLRPQDRPSDDLAPKNLIGIPWRVAFALQADGWILRLDIIWHKPNPMPESVTDRPTKAHEYLFLLSKGYRYHYDKSAIMEPVTGTAHPRGKGTHPKCAAPGGGVKMNESFSAAVRELVDMRNKRSVWTVPTAPYSGAHFACFPPKLIEPCILAGSRPGDVVFDPFFGSGTTGRVAEEHNRLWLGFDLNPEYAKLQDARTRNVQKRLPGVGG